MIGRIAYIANSRIPSRAANTVNVLNMSAAFAGAGRSVTLMARGDPAKTSSLFEDFGLGHSFELSLLPITGPAVFDRLRFIHHVRRGFAEQAFDFAYGRSCYGLLVGVPSGVDFAYDLHAFPTDWRRRRAEALLFRRRNFLFATAITRAIAEKYASVYPRLRTRILIAPCAATLAKVSAGPRPPGPTRVYYVGHLYQGRGIDLILEIARLEPDIEFHVVGGEDADVAFWSAQAPGNVRFHGYVKPVDLAAHYDHADLCVAPHGRTVGVSGGGGDIAPWMSPMKIFEYMAYGKAFVAADLPALREIVDQGVDGILCPPGDVAAWRNAIRSLQEDPNLRLRLGEAGRRKLELHHTWQQRAKAVLQFADSLRNRRNSDAFGSENR